MGTRHQGVPMIVESDGHRQVVINSTARNKPSALLVLDLIVHRDSFPGVTVQSMVHESLAEANTLDEALAANQFAIEEAVTPLGRADTVNLAEFPRYRSMLQHSTARVAAGTWPSSMCTGCACPTQSWERCIECSSLTLFSKRAGTGVFEFRKHDTDVRKVVLKMEPTILLDSVCESHRMLRTENMKEQPKKQPGTMTDWGDVADWYDQLVGESGSEYHREVVLPGTLRLLAPVIGDHVLDLACGQGVLCRLLASKGIAVTGVDAAAELIRTARTRATSGDAAPTEFHVGDARELPFLTDGQFSSVACVLAIQNMHPLGPVFTEAARLLRPGGKLVIVMMHPCFRGNKETEWGWDTAGVQYRRVDRYLLPRKTPIVTHPGKDPNKYTWSFHKPIESYVKSLRNAGMLIDAIEEWPSHKKSSSGPRARAENIAREEIPMFMAIRAVKLGSAVV